MIWLLWQVLEKHILIRLFKKYTGVSPYRYIQTVRFNKAREYLINGFPPAEAAAMAGFADQSHFTNLFRNFTGLTPGMYQKIYFAGEKMSLKNEFKGHILALMTVFIWGTTFISTKVLLNGFTPVEILFCRFVLGLAALFIVCPRVFKTGDLHKEFMFAVAGLSGVCLYYLLENIALTYTTASNVGIIISASPFFTAVLTKITIKEYKLSYKFFIGFVLAFAGIFIISFAEEGSRLNITGDVLAVAAAFVWAIYSVITKKLSIYGYNIIQSTRRIFEYGIIFMIPAVIFMGFSPDIECLLNPVYLFNILFLGFGASALCFVAWNTSLNILGAVKTSAYIYAVPVITVVTSAIVLLERLTVWTVCGVTLTVLGLIISEWGKK